MPNHAKGLFAPLFQMIIFSKQNVGVVEHLFS